MKFFEKMKAKMKTISNARKNAVKPDAATVVRSSLECLLPTIALTAIMIVLAKFWPTVVPAAVPWIGFMIIFATGTSCRRVMDKSEPLALLLYSINGILCGVGIVFAYIIGREAFMAFVERGDKIQFLYLFHAGLLLVSWGLFGLSFKLTRVKITDENVLLTYAVCLAFIILSALSYMLGVNRTAENTMAYTGIAFLVMGVYAGFAGLLAALIYTMGDKDLELQNTCGPLFLGMIGAFYFHFLLCLLGLLAYASMITVVIINIAERKK